MSVAAEQARKYLQEKNVPIIFESLMTALMYHKPDDPVDFMLRGLSVIKMDPNQKVSWDMFIDTPPPPMQQPGRSSSSSSRRLGRLNTSNEAVRRTPPPKPSTRPLTAADDVVSNNLDIVQLANVPIVLLFGGPGGRKSVVAEETTNQLAQEGENVVYVSVPEAIQGALGKYQHLTEWQNAALKFEAGQPIPDDIVLNVVKAELAKSSDAKLVILDGYPRTMSQVHDFEREVKKKPELAIIIDFDEDTLKKDMEHKEISENLISSRLQEYKSLTLPAAKHYDDAFVLQLIAGEQPSEGLVEQFKDNVKKLLHKTTNGHQTAGTVDVEAEAEDGPVNGGDDRLPPRDVPLIIIIGSPGSLKGEYCRRLVKRYDGFVHLSMGELLKERAAVNDEEGNEIQEILSKGELAPNEKCSELICKAMQEHPNSWGFILEGYPRDLAQAEHFDSQVDRIDLVLLIDCTEQYCLNNLRERLNGDEDAGKSRIAIFKQRTLPMLKHYDEKGKLKVIEGDRVADAVFQDVIHALDGVFIPQESADGKSLSNAEES